VRDTSRVIGSRGFMENLHARTYANGKYISQRTNINSTHPRNFYFYKITKFKSDEIKLGDEYFLVKYFRFFRRL